jgi:hypothetical protein
MVGTITAATTAIYPLLVLYLALLVVVLYH